MLLAPHVMNTHPHSCSVTAKIYLIISSDLRMMQCSRSFSIMFRTPSIHSWKLDDRSSFKLNFSFSLEVKIPVINFCHHRKTILRSYLPCSLLIVFNLHVNSRLKGLRKVTKTQEEGVAL